MLQEEDPEGKMPTDETIDRVILQHPGAVERQWIIYEEEARRRDIRRKRQEEEARRQAEILDSLSERPAAHHQSTQKKTSGKDNRMSEVSSLRPDLEEGELTHDSTVTTSVATTEDGTDQTQHLDPEVVHELESSRLEPNAPPHPYEPEKIDWKQKCLDMDTAITQGAKTSRNLGYALQEVKLEIQKVQNADEERGMRLATKLDQVVGQINAYIDRIDEKGEERFRRLNDRMPFRTRSGRSGKRRSGL